MIVYWHEALNHETRMGYILSLLTDCMYEEMFDILRNKQQLGYYVTCGARCTNGLHGFVFEIESANYDPKDLLKRIEDFKLSYFEGLTPEKFENWRKGRIAQLAEPHKDVLEEAFAYYGAMNENTLANQGIIWDQKADELAVVKEVTYEEFIDVYKKMMFDQKKTATFETYPEKHFGMI